MIIHVIDGTYELFRQFYGRRRFLKDDATELFAVAGVLHSVLEMIENDATHLGVATDHVIESFRNGLWAGYKTGEGIDPDLLAQFHPSGPGEEFEEWAERIGDDRLLARASAAWAT